MISGHGTEILLSMGFETLGLVHSREPGHDPLSLNIHIQILQTDLYTFPLRISWENLIKDQSIFS